MNRRTVLIGASALGLVAFGGGAFVVNTRRQADADARAAAAPPVDAALLDRPYSPSFGPADGHDHIDFSSPLLHRPGRFRCFGCCRRRPQGETDDTGYMDITANQYIAGQRYIG